MTKGRRVAFAELRILVITSLALSALSYVTNIFLANMMGPEIFGRYSYALVLGAFFGQLVFFGTAEAGIRLKISHGNAALNWIMTLKLLNFGLLLMCALTALAVKGELAVLFGLVVALNALCFTTHYEAQGRNVRYAMIYLAERGLITAALWFGLLVLETGYLVWVFSALFAVQSSSLAFQYWENRQYRLSLNVRALLETYKEGFFIVIFGLSKFAYGGITRILIFNQLGDERMGIFSTAWQFVPLATLYFAQATKAWRLRITEALDARDAIATKRQVLALSSTVLLPTLLASTILFFFGDQIIVLLFTSEFSDAGELMPYLGVYFLVVGFDSVTNLLAFAISLSRPASAIYLVFGVLTVLACLLVIERQGLEACMVAIIIGHFCAATILALATAREIGRILR